MTSLYCSTAQEVLKRLDQNCSLNFAAWNEFGLFWLAHVERISFNWIPQIKKIFSRSIAVKSGGFLLFNAVVICPNLFSLCWWKTEWFHRPCHICSVYRNGSTESNLFGHNRTDQKCFHLTLSLRLVLLVSGSWGRTPQSAGLAFSMSKGWSWGPWGYFPI